MLQEKLRAIISGYPNFPKEGILFRDLTPLFREPDLYDELIEEMSLSSDLKDSDCIVAIDARGFLFASCIANRVKKPMILARKKDKLPGTLLENSYNLEYGTNILTIQKESIVQYKKFVIIDDLLATGGTIKCVADILESENKEIKAALVVAELTELKARESFRFPVISQIKY